MVVAQAQSIEVSAEGVVFAFLPTHRSLRERFEETRPWIEAAAERLAGRKVTVRSIQVEGGAAAPVVPVAPRDDEGPASTNGRKDSEGRGHGRTRGAGRPRGVPGGNQGRGGTLT